MKRRDFIASAAILSFLTPEAWAAKKKSSAQKASHKATGKSSKKGKSGKGKKSSGPVAHTAESPVTDRPPVGTSASRLPPVKAAEPPAEWTSYEITTTLELPRSEQRTRVWLPLPLNQDTLYQRTIGHQWQDNADSANLRRLPDGDLESYYCEWNAGTAPRLTLTTLVTTADRHFDITRRTVAPEREDILRRNLQASTQIPNDGLAHTLGERIVGRIKDPVAQAKSIYDWVVDNTVYNPDLPAGGSGDVRKQLESGQYGGRSADINGLFVALCRGIGIPARRVYGLRVAPSRLFRSLGVANESASRDQHCRAEFYIPGYGWIPVDPSDARRAIALEGLSDRDSKLTALKKILFGVWEMNWVAFNVGNDLTLPQASTRLPFFILPRLETGDNGDTATLPFKIRARRVEI